MKENELNVYPDVISYIENAVDDHEVKQGDLLLFNQCNCEEDIKEPFAGKVVDIIDNHFICEYKGKKYKYVKMVVTVKLAPLRKRTIYLSKERL